MPTSGQHSGYLCLPSNRFQIGGRNRQWGRTKCAYSHLDREARNGRRLRQRIETVFDWVVAQGWRSDNPAGRAVTRALPRHSGVKNHYEALHYSDVPAAMAKVRESSSDLITRLSLEFLVLTAARSSEVRLARWSEIDLTSNTWTVPAERMKARREHRVPLCRRAKEILLEVQQGNSQDSEQETGLVFPGGAGAGPWPT